MYKFFLLFLVFFLRLESVDYSSFLSKNEIKAFYQNGYIIKRNALPRSQVFEVSYLFDKTMHSIVKELLKNHYSISNQTQKEYIDGTQVVFKKKTEQNISILRFVGCGSIEPKFLSLLRSDKMLNTFFDLLETEELEHLICQMHPKMPNDGTAFDKHRDIDNRMNFDPNWIDIQKNGSYAICIIPLDKMSSKNGGLYVDKASFPVQQEGKEEIVALEMNPGDLLFMHPHLVHWSHENQSNEARRTLLTGFCVFGANHKNYPGNCTNDICYKDKSIKSADWKVLDDTDF